MVAEDIPAYLDEDEDQQYADPERAATQVPELAAVLDGADNERAAEFRREADRLVLDEAEFVPAAAARRLYDFARHHPSIVAAQAPTLVAHLDADNEDVRRRVAFAVMEAVTEPEPFVSYAPTFIRLLDDDDPVVRRTATGTLGKIAAVSSDDVVPAVDALVALVDDPEIRFVATEALARIGDDRPEAITAAAQPVTRHFRDLPAAENTEADDWVFRVSALEVIANIALATPEAIDDVSDVLHRAIQSIQIDVRIQAADTIGVLITERPETFNGFEKHLRAGLNDVESRMRRAALLAYLWIGFNNPAAVDDPDAIAERLRMFDETFDVPAEDLAKAVQAFDGVTEGEH
jgi:HEAT repeat protein